MESRLRIFLLKLAFAALVVATAAGCSRNLAAEADKDQAKPVVEPKVERREIKTPKIRSSDFEIGIFAGVLGIEDFGTNLSYGANFTYHITEDFFAQATYGQSTAGKTSFEVLNGSVQLLTPSQRKFRYYDLEVGYNVLPGEVFVGRNHAFNSALYLIAGAGNTHFAADDFFTISVGLGYRLLLTRSIALHADLKDFLFQDAILGKNKTTNNLQFSLGASWYFGW
jgi:outer membrane beta-barrel protein